MVTGKKQAYNEEGSDDHEHRKMAPKGHFVVYVGKELQRFVVPLSYLKNSSFQKLLHKAAEEYDFDYSQGILIPCDQSDFVKVVKRSTIVC